MDINLVIGVTGLVFGALGIFVGIYESRKYKGPRLCYQFDGRSIIRHNDSIIPNKIKVTYEKKSINCLTHSQIVLWNAGGSALRNTDVVGNKLTLHFFEKPLILQLGLSKLTNSANGFEMKLSPAGDEVDLQFDYLDSSDGVLMEVWHCSERVVPIINGTIIGHKSGPYNLGRFLGPRPNVMGRHIDPADPMGFLINSLRRSIYGAYAIIPWLAIGLGFVAFVYGMMWLAVDRWQIGGTSLKNHFLASPTSYSKAYAAPITIGLSYLIIGVFTWRQIRRRFPKILRPNDLYEPADEKNSTSE